MKWDDEKKEKLKELILVGKKHEDIANIFCVTKKSVSNQCFKLGLKIVNHKFYRCENCEAEFYDLIKSNRKFCSSSCAGYYNTSKRIHSDCTKEKIRLSRIGKKASKETIEKLSGKNSPNWKGGISIKKRTKKIDGKKKCKYCDEFKVSDKYRLICEACRADYYEAYRPSCEFRFDINSLKDEFDFSLIEQYGWYSPSNKNNNLNGVSRDHSYSVRDGFINKVAPEIIAHPANCKLMKHSDNISKHSSSSITLEELIKMIELWDSKYLV